MTAHEAKSLSLEVWRYLRDHPDCVYKEQIPRDLFYKIQLMVHRCPLCDYQAGSPDFIDGPEWNARICSGCCLSSSNPACADGHFERRAVSENESDRAYHAGEIVKLIEAWEV